MSMSEIENSYSESGHDENQDSGNIAVAPVALIAKDSLNKITELPLSRALMEPSPFDAPMPRLSSVGSSSSILIPERRPDYLLQDAYAAQRDSLLRQSSQNSDDAEACAQTLFQGATFTKLGQFGKPKPKFLVCSQDGNLFWSDVSGGKTLSSIRLLHVTAVQKGKGAELFQRKQAKDIPEELCFSILTKDRSLDLVAESEQTRDYWVKAVLLAAENVQTTGKVARVPVSASTDRERKDRELERTLQELNNQLSQTKQAVFQKTQELLEKEQLLVAQREETSAHVADREAEAEKLRVETERLRQEQEELNQRLKKVHHERELSRSERLAEMATLQSELARAEEARQELEQKASTEKTQLKTVVEESHKLLAKAKDTIHKRQQSRQQRVAVIEALQTENEELRSRNLELRQAMAVHKAQIEQWNKIVQLAAGNYHLSKLLKDGGVDLNPAAVMAKPEAKEAPAPSMASISETKSDETGVISAAEVLTKEMWQPDEESAQCIRCNNTFTFFKRRHHCRKCGVLVCGPCSKSRAKVAETKDKVRVCCTCVSPSCAPSPALSRKAPSTPVAN